MPNWCSTMITIQSEDNKAMGQFANLLQEWTNKNYMDNGFGKSWLGNVVLGSDIGTVDSCADTDIRCRGYITYIDYDGEGYLKVETETAWAPMLKMWLQLMEKYLPDAELLYSAEEGGMGIYATNDPDLIGRYQIDPWDCDSIEPTWNIEKTELVKLLQELLQTDESDLDILLRKLEGSQYADSVYIHQWEFADVSDWE